jgi:hypothetical protein
MYAPMAQPQPGVINLNDEVPLAHIQMHGPGPGSGPIPMQLMHAPAPMHMQDVCELLSLSFSWSACAGL